MKYPSPITPGCLLSSPTFWKLSGLIFSSVASFFGKLFTWTKFCFTFNKCSFTYHANTFLLTCGSKGKCLVINSSYTPTFRLFSTYFLTTLQTYLSLPHSMVAHLSQCKRGHTIDDLSTHLLQCPYKNEHTIAHNTFWDIIMAIVLESRTHV